MEKTSNSRQGGWQAPVANGLTIVISLLIGYIVMEAIYRIAASRLRGNLFVFSRPFYDFDFTLGYRYKNEGGATIALLDAQGRKMLLAHPQVNLNGHLSGREDAIAKPRGEYRIAVLGDSMTACVMNRRSWPDLLQDRLGADKGWLASLGARSIRVINFGMDGTGIVQWPRSLDSEVLKYSPDLVLVNLISDDIFRRFLWRKRVKVPGTNSGAEAILACTSLPADPSNPGCAYFNGIVLNEAVENRLGRVKSTWTALALEQRKRLPWWSPYPFLLSRVAGPAFGLDRYFTSLQSRYDRRTGLKASADALNYIQQKSPDLLIIHNPVYEETISARPPQIPSDLMAEAPRLQIRSLYTQMRNVLQRGELSTWFNLPYDPHFSDLGAESYATLVSGEVKRHTAARRANNLWSEAPSTPAIRTIR